MAVYTIDAPTTKARLGSLTQTLDGTLQRIVNYKAFLDTIPDAELDACIADWLARDVAALVVFEPRGVTGHPDHRAATRAAHPSPSPTSIPGASRASAPRTTRWRARPRPRRHHHRPDR